MRSGSCYALGAAACSADATRSIVSRVVRAAIIPSMEVDVKKILLLLLIAVIPQFAILAHAQSDSARSLTAKELQTLVSPIALYPDPLLGLILPAAVYPDQIVDAALLIRTQSDAKLIAQQSWDSSVKGIATYPGVLKMMFEKIDWTKQLGDAFLNQNDQLRDTIQALRAKAQDVGNLRTTPEQQVSSKKVDGTTVIVIEPTQPEKIYVPQYTEVVYTQQAPPQTNYLAPVVTFGLGMALGAAIANNNNHNDVYVYGGYPGRVAWYDHGSYNHWHDERADYIKDRQNFRQDAYKDQVNFRQDAYKDRTNYRQDQFEDSKNFRQDQVKDRQNYRQDQIKNGNYSGARQPTQQQRDNYQAKKASASERGWGSGQKADSARAARSSVSSSAL